MPVVTIDGREVRVGPGATVLDAARALGIDVPTLCQVESCAPSPSCMACVVRVQGRPGLVPSCATPAQDGMVVESETEVVRAARRTALELLLGDHVGDCRAPCHRICPVDLEVPLVLRLIGAGQVDQAIATVRREVPLAGVLGRICPAPCEAGCRRGGHDAPVAIRNVERWVADADRERPAPWQPPAAAAQGQRVAVVGAGPTGLAAAWFLRLKGIACTVFERTGEAGGILRDVPRSELPRAVLAAEVDGLRRLGVDLRFGVEVGATVSLEELRREHDAVLIAAGAAAPAGFFGGKAVTSTGATDVPVVFAAGDAVRPRQRPLEALADGKRAARELARLLAGASVSRGSESVSILGRLREGEMAEFLQGANPAERVGPGRGLPAAYTAEEATRESGRCVHCDCRKYTDCRLRRWAEAYGADRSAWTGERRRFERRMDHPFVVYEPGKCIACGICVRVAAQGQEAVGLTFVGRGFDVRVAVPFGATLAQGLERVAERCVRCCPTGALAAITSPPPRT